MTVSINGSGAITFNDASTQSTAATGFGFKNRIINGAMVIDQRNAGASVTTGYAVDRFNNFLSYTSNFTYQQNAGGLTGTNLPTGFTSYLGVTVGTGRTVSSGDVGILFQSIEGNNIADLGWGTSNAQAVTLSFWVRSSLTGTHSGSFLNSGDSRSYVFQFSISSANTWEQKNVTITGDTSGTWLTNNGKGITVAFNTGSGSSGLKAAGSWGAGGAYGATGSIQLCATSGATFYITGVQLEKGSTATSFDYRPYGTELALCQRYYYRLKAGSSYANAGIGRAYATTNGQAIVAMPVSMRTAPTGGYSALSDWNAAQASGNITAMSPAAQYSLDYRQMTIDITATMISGQSVILNANNTTNAWIDWSAEL